MAILLLLLVGSIFITACILVALGTGYLSRRFYKLVRERGREGIGAFIQETIQLITPAGAPDVARDVSSDGSAVVVD